MTNVVVINKQTCHKISLAINTTPHSNTIPIPVFRHAVQESEEEEKEEGKKCSFSRR